MTTVCELATKLPKIIGGLLDCESKLKRGRFREETLTDIFTGALTAFVGKSLVIQYPPEAKTGSDLDIDFWHVSSGDYLGLRIQAKRLNAATQQGKPVKPEVRSYKELLHQVPGTGNYQFRTLMKYAGKRMPLYMFYNHAAITRDSFYSGKQPAVRGINLAFASDVSMLMEKKLRKSKGSSINKRLEKLRPYFFDLSVIFCPLLRSGEMVPTPGSVRIALQEAWERTMADLAANVPADELPAVYARRRILRETEIKFPEASFQLTDGPAVRFNRNIERPAITFISGRSDEIPGPTISDEIQFD